MVCGPTASGKSDVADELAELVSETLGAWVPTLVVDAMQVYREIPTITNQARRRSAELLSVASVTEKWTVARHRDLALEMIDAAPGETAPFVLDAGTGMYLNAILLHMPLAPKVPREVRALAEEATAGETNPRRAARTKELELAGVPPRGSVWDGDLRYDVAGIYLRPDRAELDARISVRSRKIAREGVGEAERLRTLAEEGTWINPSVLDSIGVRELLGHLHGEISLDEASLRISARTRRLARRQMRWFDKLTRMLEGRANVQVLQDPAEVKTLHSIHAIMRA